MFWPCSTGEAVKWKVIVELLLLSVASCTGESVTRKIAGLESCRIH